MPDKYAKLSISLRYWLLGMAERDKAYLVAVDALEFARYRHTGLRKDGVTPEFQHQLEIMHYVRTMHSGLLHPAETLAVGALHDVAEDKDVSHRELADLFGAQVADSTFRVTKKFRGEHRNPDVLFSEMANDPVASVIKGADRIQNQNSMLGVFKAHKQREYMEETETRIIPMLKLARRRFTAQESVYENVKFVLRSQMAMLRATLAQPQAGELAEA